MACVAFGSATQEDPIGVAGGLNLYGYTGGDPINFSDPFGLCPVGLPGVIAWLRGCRHVAMDRAASEVIRQAIALIPRTTQECRELAETAGRLHSEGRIGLYKGGDARDNAYTHGGKGGNIDVNVAEIDTDSTRVRFMALSST